MYYIDIIDASWAKGAGGSFTEVWHQPKVLLVQLSVAFVRKKSEQANSRWEH